MKREARARSIDQHFPKISGLYAITPDLTNTGELLAKTQQVLIGGVQLVQYRSKSANVALLREQAGLMRQLCSEYRVPLIINDHIDLVIAVDADGVHVGREDAGVAAARKHLGENKIVGASCYNDLERAQRAEQDGADYVAFGAFFPSLTKTDAVSVPGHLTGQAKQKISIPIVGIGGIRLGNARQVITSGCAAIAVCADLFMSGDITARAKQFTQLFAEFSIPTNN
ncbi:MAG: thiamine phosphate synthase [Nitrosomonas sp.]|nr:thiamine phosphate synthase [Nitrosomonas sp.]